MQLEFPAPMTGAFLLGLLLAFAGTDRLEKFPAGDRGTAFPGAAALGGALWAAAGVGVFYVLGVVLGQATTGSSRPTQAAGALLLAVAGGWIAGADPGRSLQHLSGPGDSH